MGRGKGDNAAIFVVVTDLPVKIIGKKTSFPKVDVLIPLIQDKDKPQPHFWKLPGGRFESIRDDNFKGAGVRELKEELGWNIVKLTRFHGVNVPKGFGSIFSLVKLRFYSARYESGETKKGPDIRDYWFYTPKEIKDLIEAEQVLPEHAKALMEYFALNNINLS